MGYYKHVIWDWNGTILDDAWLCLEVLNIQLARRGLDVITLERYQETFCHPISEHYKKNGFVCTGDFADVFAEFVDLYSEREAGCGLRLGVLDAIQSIHDMGIGQSILSAYHQDGLDTAVGRFNSDLAMFTNVVGMTNRCHEGKAEMGKKLIARLKIHPDHILYIGDVIADYKSANEMGVACILISGTQSRDRLSECGAKVIDNFSELLK